MTPSDEHAPLSGVEIEARLGRLGFTLPAPLSPVAAYLPVIVAGSMAYVSGQISMSDGQLIRGRVGEDLSLEQGIDAARSCALMIVAQLKSALPSLDRVERIVKLGVFVNSAPDFADQPKVANGASELMVAIFGPAGRHARSAVGVPVLPLGVAVEIDAIVSLRSA